MSQCRLKHIFQCETVKTNHLRNVSVIQESHVHVQHIKDANINIGVTTLISPINTTLPEIPITWSIMYQFTLKNVEMIIY